MGFFSPDTVDRPDSRPHLHQSRKLLLVEHVFFRRFPEELITIIGRPVPVLERR